jgi:hypothetical protein
MHSASQGRRLSGCRDLACAEQFRVMAFAQLARREALRGSRAITVLSESSDVVRSIVNVVEQTVGRGIVFRISLPAGVC